MGIEEFIKNALTEPHFHILAAGMAASAYYIVRTYRLSAYAPKVEEDPTGLAKELWELHLNFQHMDENGNYLPIFDKNAKDFLKACKEVTMVLPRIISYGVREAKALIHPNNPRCVRVYISNSSASNESYIEFVEDERSIKKKFRLDSDQLSALLGQVHQLIFKQKYPIRIV